MPAGANFERGSRNMADYRVLIVDDNTGYLENMSGYFSA